MRHWIAIALAVAGIAVTGCTNDQSASRSSAMKDDCPHCPGVQKANADGTCPQCGMKVSMMDACPTCPGVQTATADGKCPMCGGKVTGA